MATPTPIRRAQSLDFERPLPQNLQAERAVLGSILLDNESLKTARTQLQPTDFSQTHHKIIFQTMIELAEVGSPIDTLLLMERLTSKGKLEDAGGNAYLSQLADGLPRITNVAHYATIVSEKAQMRRLIYAAEAAKESAFDPALRPADVLARIQTEIEQAGNRNSQNPAKVISLRDVLAMDLQPLEFVFEPLLTVGGTMEMYGWRGTGKSLVATWIGMRIAAGKPLLFPHPAAGGNWPVKHRLRVLYVYGEMHAAMIKDRAFQIARGEGLEHGPDPEWFGIMCKDFQKRWRPKLSTPQDRRYVEQRILEGGYQLVIFDNISTLWPSSQEGEGERSAELSDFFNDLNQQGISVIFLHHAGKGGTQRGSSEKEDMLDAVLRLQRPANKRDEKSLRVEIAQEKCRAECKQARWLTPFELSLETCANIAEWTIRPARHAQLEAAFEMFRNGAKTPDVFAELGIPRSTAYRYRKQYDENPDPKHWANDPE